MEPSLRCGCQETDYSISKIKHISDHTLGPPGRKDDKSAGGADAKTGGDGNDDNENEGEEEKKFEIHGPDGEVHFEKLLPSS